MTPSARWWISLTSVEREVQDREGRWYSLRIRPYRTRENKIDGAVMLLVDIDEHKRAVELVMSAVKQPLLSLTANFGSRGPTRPFTKPFTSVRRKRKTVTFMNSAVANGTSRDCGPSWKIFCPNKRRWMILKWTPTFRALAAAPCAWMPAATPTTAAAPRN